MSEKIIERLYKVYTGYQNYHYISRGDAIRGRVDWSYDKSFKTYADAESYADCISERYEFVKIETKED